MKVNEGAIPRWMIVATREFGFASSLFSPNRISRVIGSSS